MDIIVVGAGMSGSLAAIMLSRQGFSVAVVDRYQKYPADFRAEQIVGSQLKLFNDLGLSASLVADVRAVGQARNYQLGRQLASVTTPHYGMPYRDMVQAVRSQIPPEVQFIVGRAADVETGPHPTVHLEGGQRLAAKLVVMATGLNTALSSRLGVQYQAISAKHSTTLGFDITSPKCSAADTPILVYYGNKLQDRIDYLTIFPCKDVLRANLFLYREPSDPWVVQLRQRLRETLLDVLPALHDHLGEFTVDHVQCRSSDVAVLQNHQRDGIVYIGDAYQTPCPAAGTGISRLAVDVERLAAHAERWFAIGDFSAKSLRSYYDDPVKRRSDLGAIRRAKFRRSISVNPSLAWGVRRQTINARRFIKYVLTYPINAGLNIGQRGRAISEWGLKRQVIQSAAWLLWRRMAPRPGISLGTPAQDGND